MSNIEIIDNFFDKDTFLEITSKIYDGSWVFGSSSNREQSTNGNIIEEKINGNYLNPSSKTIPFWNMDLSKSNYFKNIIFSTIKDKLNIDYKIDLIYANGQTFGQSGDCHIDHINGYTFLLYCNRIWNFDWGGKTAFLYPDNTTEYIDAKPNRAIFFPGSIIHRSEEVSRNFTGLRITLAYKLLP